MVLCLLTRRIAASRLRLINPSHPSIAPSITPSPLTPSTPPRAAKNIEFLEEELEISANVKKNSKKLVDDIAKKVKDF